MSYKVSMPKVVSYHPYTYNDYTRKYEQVSNDCLDDYNEAVYNKETQEMEQVNAKDVHFDFYEYNEMNKSQQQEFNSFVSRVNEHINYLEEVLRIERKYALINANIHNEFINKLGNLNGND